MNNLIAVRGVLRASPPGTHGVGSMELFFDLVYVFTIIQLSHFLLHDLSWQGAAEGLILFAAIWWAWNYTAWAMNWLDPERPLVRALLAFLMAMALAMALAIPDAFSERAGWFVGAYVVFQLVRSAFMVWAFRGTTMARNYGQLLAWSGLSSGVWIVGLSVPEEFRVPVWGLAVIIDYAAPGLGFWIPGIGRSDMRSWPLDEAHLAERNRLIFLIALGESILLLGGTLLDGDITVPQLVAAVVGYVGILLLFLLYFASKTGNRHHDAPSVDRATHIARGAYAYAHALMIAGAILCAVSVELVVAHPLDDATLPVMFVMSGGPVLYLLGNVIFVGAHTGTVPWSRAGAALALAAVVPVGLATTNMLASILVVAVLATVVVVDRIRVRHR